MRTQPLIRPPLAPGFWGIVGEPSMTNRIHVVDMPKPLRPLMVYAASIREAQTVAETIVKMHAIRH